MSKLDMMQSIYDFCLLYKSDPFGIVKLQIDDTLLLINNQFADAENEIIKFIKFNDIIIELTANEKLIMSPNMQIFNIFLIKNFKTSMINNKNVIHTELSPKNQHVAH